MPASERPAWVVDVVDPAPGERILEVGCGRGELLALLAERLTTGFVVGIDRSAALIAVAERRNRAAIDVGRVRLVLGDVTEVRLDEQAFDVVVASDVRAFRTPAAPEWEVAGRVLAPSGRAVVAHELVDGEPERLIEQYVQEAAVAPGLQLVAVHHGRTMPSQTVALELRARPG